MPEETVPLSVDLEAAVRLSREAILARAGAEARTEEFADRFEAGLRAGDRSGALFRPAGPPVGVAIWAAHGPLGAVVDLVYLEPAAASVEEYARFWAGVRRLAGPVAFARGEVTGLTPSEEERLMTGLGFARFGRSEMQRGDAPVPPAELPEGYRLRRVGLRDAAELVRLHRAAYRDRFDRYLFLEDADEERDTERMLRELFEGRWGEFAPDGSWGVERDGRLVGATLSVRRPPGVLIADVMVDPAEQGHGLGQAVMLGTLAGLAGAGISPVVLAVTEGNDRAIRLYERLGFVRSLGPSVDWYDPARIPVAP